ncbi:MAG: response regulator [Proteobacteria bacterium]|nr:MAG: response regulator [Pseudomonadota bacterium]
MTTEINPTHTYYGRAPQTNGSVLVVEDDDAIRESLSTMLREEGFLVHEAINGLEAIGLLVNQELKPSLILLDLIMPHMGGAEFLAALEKESEWKDLRVAMLSAARVGAISPMIVANLAKPVDIEELLGLVHFYAPSFPEKAPCYQAASYPLLT